MKLKPLMRAILEDNNSNLIMANVPPSETDSGDFTSEEDSAVLLLINQIESKPEVIKALRNLQTPTAKYKAILQFGQMLGIPQDEFHTQIDNFQIYSKQNEEVLNEIEKKPLFSTMKDMDNWETILKKPNNIHSNSISDWELYKTLIKKTPISGRPFKIQTPLYKYGMIKDKSWFGKKGPWETYRANHIISNNVIKLTRVEHGGHGYTELLFIRGKGVYVIGGNSGKRDLALIPDEFKKYVE